MHPGIFEDSRIIISSSNVKPKTESPITQFCTYVPTFVDCLHGLVELLLLPVQPLELPRLEGAAVDLGDAAPGQGHLGRRRAGGQQGGGALLAGGRGGGQGGGRRHGGGHGDGPGHGGGRRGGRGGRRGHDGGEGKVTRFKHVATADALPALALSGTAASAGAL